MLIPIPPSELSGHPYLKKFRLRLRRNITPAEDRIGDLLVVLKIRFKFQQVFSCPRTKVHYIADYWVPSYRVVIECDGWQHRTQSGLRSDQTRDASFLLAGITTLRLVNKSCFLLSSPQLLSLLTSTPRTSSPLTSFHPEKSAWPGKIKISRS